MTRLLITLATANLPKNPTAGGYWSLYLQYLLGLRALGHEVLCLQQLRSTGDRASDRSVAAGFLRRMSELGFADRCALLLYDKPPLALETAEVWGLERAVLKERIAATDLLWNFALTLRPPVLGAFRHRVLIDGDPGHLQLTALNDELVAEHETFFTVGLAMHDPACRVPKHGVRWHTFPQVVYLPMWEPAPDPGPTAPFTSVTNWTWEQLKFDRGLVSASKRDAYLRCLRLPALSRLPFELAAHIHPEDHTGDREALGSHGWRLVDPTAVASTPDDFRRYVRRSRAEICCPKPVYSELRTGWISERSACYLASGRPVLMGDTGIQGYLPTGDGLRLFHDLDDAVEGAADIHARYARHSRAARDIAIDHFDSSRTLRTMLGHCGC